ncbi:MAG: peptide chain release factor 1 [Anaerolineae bacterium]|nr:peptide chain release factor 1 [Anaerolineae bacterium]MCB0204826.1 peptide chain release factor 1 [Anaerolineae bacterium]MCB0255972.1 peptide chain release factor 1 [Anaerolineae bacterium]
MIDSLVNAERRYDELALLLASPEVTSDYEEMIRLARERSELQDLVETYHRYRDTESELDDARTLLVEDDQDPELIELIEDEIARLEAQLERLEHELQRMLLPTDPNDSKNVIVEIRAGTGGDEAGLFAADLFRMYSRWAEAQRYKVEMLSNNETGIGGFKEVIFSVRGQGAYSRLKYESGVHRVQRVPVTESQGRIHTSTATVAVLPEMSEVEVDVSPNDIRIDVFRAGGPGGQSVNTTDSAVRITHLPTGLVVQCQDEKSQLQNRARAMQILRARLYAAEMDRQLQEQTEARRSQVGTGERSEKVRTYNFPQSRVTDHRIGLTLYRLEAILEGDLDEMINALMNDEQAERLASLSDDSDE